MRRTLTLWLAVAAFSCTKDPGAGSAATATSTATATATASAPATCSVGGACSSDGAMCTPAPVGSSWSHALRCMGGKWTELEIAPLPHAAEGRAGVAIPKLDTSCNAAADCVVESDDIDGKWACCAGCTQRAASKSWEQQFKAACASSPPQQCPPLGCAMANVHAECRSHVCTLVPDHAK